MDPLRPRRRSQGWRHLRNARRQDSAPHPHRWHRRPRATAAPYSTASKDNLSRLVFNRSVEARCYKRDRYGGNVCRVFGDKGQDVGLEMVRAGMAWWYREYAKEQTPEEQGAYQGAEDAARVTKRGLWKEPKQGAAVGVAG